VPFKEMTAMSELREFVGLASEPGANRRALCRRFGISPQTGYKWLARYAAQGVDGLAKRSSRPLVSPKRSSEEVEQAVLEQRKAHPVWGGRKLRARMQEEQAKHVPSASTITEILRRHGQLDPVRAGKPREYRRFEHPAPNQLWQMDFKGHFALMDGPGTRCHPFTVIDDHSRYSLCVRACLDERGETVQGVLTDVFRRYGLPHRITADNGSPWGNTNGESLTWLGVWIVRLGIKLSHSSPGHPQTQGKDERLHRTLDIELLFRESFLSCDDAQGGMDRWREQYNHVRPHEALALKTPSSRYQVSVRTFPEVLPAIEYDDQDLVRKVQSNGLISFQGKEYRIGRGLRGLPVALRRTEQEGRWNMYFCHQQIGQVDARTAVFKRMTRVREEANEEALSPSETP
jgi:transposase InsO family protein